MIGQEKKLGFDPLSVSYFQNGEFMVVAGTNKKLTLWNKDGIRLGDIGEMNDWVWSTQVY